MSMVSPPTDHNRAWAAARMDFAKTALGSGALDAAYFAVADVIFHHPNDAALLREAGALHRSSGDLPQALAYLLRAQAAHPATPAIARAIAAVYRAAGQGDAASGVQPTFNALIGSERRQFFIPKSFWKIGPARRAQRRHLAAVIAQNALTPSPRVAFGQRCWFVSRHAATAVAQPALAPLENDRQPMTYKTLAEIRFSPGGNADGAIGIGWADAEQHGRWTNGIDSTLMLNGLVHGHRYHVEIKLGPFLSPPECMRQVLKIFANNILCYETELTDNVTARFVIPQAALNASRKVELRLHCPTAISPMALGKSIDVRQLGLAVWQLTVSEATLLADTAIDAAGTIARPIPNFGGGSADVALAGQQKVAAVTMVYNEPDYLPIWLAHYSRQVGAENCYIIDHGSDDGSTDRLVGCNVIRIPRSPYDPFKQSAFNSQFCTSLLQWFDWVVYADVDEMVMADPRIAADLRQYCRRPLPDVVAAIGLNCAHRPQAEPPLDFARKVTEQRQYVFTASSMCKPILTRKPIVWSPGSHSSDAELVFDHLYLFHLRWFDLPYGLRRLHKTREMDWARADAGQHQRVQDDEMTRYFMGFANMPIIDAMELDPTIDPVRPFLDQVVASQIGRQNETYKIALDIWSDRLWRLPSRFVGAF